MLSALASSCPGFRASPENIWMSLLLCFPFSQTAQACWTWSPSRTFKTTCCRPWSSSSSWTTQSPHSCSPRCSRRWQTSGRSSQNMCSYCMWSRRRRRTWAFTPCSRRSTRIYISIKKTLPPTPGWRAPSFNCTITLEGKIWQLRNLLWKSILKTKGFRTWSILCILFIKIHLQFTFNIKNYHIMKLFIVKIEYMSPVLPSQICMQISPFYFFPPFFLGLSLTCVCAYICVYLCAGDVHMCGGPEIALGTLLRSIICLLWEGVFHCPETNK